jgi:hypothetical protein
MTNYINNTPVNSLYGRSISGTSNQPFVDVFLPRDPDVTDTQYLVQQKWLNTADNVYWVLEGFSSVGGNVIPIWIKFGSEGLTETLTGNTGGAVPATLNNINVVGDGTYITTVGNPLTSTLTIEPAGGIATLYTEDAGTASAAAGNLNVFGGTGIHTTGSGNTITIAGKIAQAAATSSLTNDGVSSYLNTQFSVDANGFVTLLPTVYSYTQVNHAESPYVVISTDHYISCLTSTGTITIELPNVPSNYRIFIIKDHDGSAFTNNITITTVGGTVTIDGATSYTIVSNYGAINLLFNGTSYEIY